MKRKIVISINTAWNIYNFRAGLIRALLQEGYDVVALAPKDDYSQKLRDLGCQVIDLPMDNNGTHPGRDMLLLARYYRVLRFLKPYAFLGYTVKPNVYGSLAAHALGIPVINNIAGLGATFIRDSFITKIVRTLYKVALKRSHKVFFQNADDLALFTRSGLVRQQITSLVPGSGLNLNHYKLAPADGVETRPFRFLLVARMLKDKGVEEFVEAARHVRRTHRAVEFHLLGGAGTGNPNAIPAQRLAEWQDEGLVIYHGKTDDVRPYLSSTDCVVLPSYREGVPRSLLEAAAMSLPIIATDVVGCRDAVDDQVTGLLCEVKNPASLAEKMLAMIALPAEQRLAMGAAGRRKVETQFDEQIVIQKYLQALDAVVRPLPVETDMAELMPEQINS
ncbi:Glycosyltransferase involved in cell wall bisynthesis [Massilia sp. PDC64]|nr:glycosyltransferase family 4 protein [Massilia sp. PDC64]SDC22268.1 Glycosyltransferase involved in cell wall bisynthesis [Massilia sp. PDC64]